MYINAVIKHISIPIFGLFLVILGAFFVPTNSNAQSSGYYSGGNSALFDFGGVPGFSGGLQNGGTETLFEANVNGSGGANLLGCGGVDILSYFNITFNVGEFVDNFKAYMKTMAAKLLLTTLFVSPQIAAIFDTIQAIGNARLDMFKANCDLGEIRSVAKDAYNKVREECIKKLGGGPEAELKCGDNYNKASSNALSDAADKLFEYVCAMSNITENLASTDSYCGKNPNSTVCGLSAFIPRMKLSISGGAGNKQHSCKTATIGGSGPNIAPAILPFTGAMFSMSKAYQENIQKPMFKSIDKALEVLSPDQLAISLNNWEASGGASPDKRAFNNKSSNPTRISYYNVDSIPVAFGGGKKETDNIKQFKLYINCTNSNPYKTMESYIAQVNSDWHTNLSTNMADNINSDSQQNLTNLIALDKAKSKQLGIDLVEAGELMETATNCVANHFIHISPATMLSFVSLPNEVKDSYIKAAGNRAAILSTELIMRFVKHKIMEGFIELASTAANGHPYYEGGGCPKKGGRVLTPMEIKKKRLEGEDPKACQKENWPYPTGVMDSIKMMIEIVENQLQAIKEIKEEETSFATISSVIAKKQKEASGK